ncbi:ATP-grasp fold amidoligase family protein [Nesterenkonia sandarakina]|uniref:Teichuronopeptide biosynthesis TupA-like protein n=1 Tax=Nesterenkonia sandarakina TaxID=272918 RepID=A0A7Z0EAZ3_9MICC|nr:ATP-grasp fold amidoligase family protein [Nesterenkonia sandarakina]NYJ17875.1 hypothetical protein [Nesterenkonia sandarakina]
MKNLRSQMLQRVPGISWRDRKLEFLETRLAGVEAERRKLTQQLDDARDQVARSRGGTAEAVSRAARLSEELKAAEQLSREERLRRRAPSFEALLSAYAAQHKAALRLGDRSHSPMAQVPYKLRNYSLAQSHGVRTPRISGVWSVANEVTLSEVSSERIVLKGDGGHSAQGVFPLERTSDGWRSLDGGIRFTGDVPPPEVLGPLGRARAPFFAEEFLESPSGWTIPEDVKLYCAYGQVLQVYVMRSSSDGNMVRQNFSSRFFDADGEPFDEIRRGLRYDTGIDAPRQLPELVEAARHLSCAVGLPFIRVDMYATRNGPVLGELTSVPSGGKQSYTQDHDQLMGQAWVNAAAALERDLMLGRPFGTLYGDADFAWMYPEAQDKTNMHHPDNWTRRMGRCSQWCAADSHGDRGPGALDVS